MFRQLLLAFGLATCTGLADAHEFWISGTEMALPIDGTFVPDVWVGEDLTGRQFSWRPQAYSSAFWVTPSGALPLHTTRVGAPEIPLRALEPGLHILSIASFGQSLTYQSPEKFYDFLRDISRQDLIATQHADDSTGPIKETYRRLSKTLVHFGDPKGEDSRVGAEGEWVRTADGYTLYFEGKVVPDQHARIECRSKDTDFWEIPVKTNAHGEVAAELPASSDCLINTVLLSRDHADARWMSIWISHFHATN